MGQRTPAVSINFGGKDRNLIFDFNAIGELEDQAGTFASESPKIKLLRAAVWACLLSETLDARGRPTKNTLSLSEVGEVMASMKPEELAELASKSNEAMRLARPDLFTEEAKPDPLPASAESPAA